MEPRFPLHGDKLRQGFSDTFEWIRNNTDESTVLATLYDPMYYLYTRRRRSNPVYISQEHTFIRMITPPSLM